jgi:3-hydroxyacyl-CoA dehydrogenase
VSEAVSRERVPSGITQSREGAVAVIAMANPPVNALNQMMRAELLTALEAADADPTVAAIVVHGVGRHFVAGADILEFDAPPKPPLLNDALLRVEDCTKPVIAALHGSVLGGGFELALACHYRVATLDTRLAFPELSLGLFPGAGGTLRLPRLVGPKIALELMLSGEDVAPPRALTLGIIDRLLGNPEALEGAIAYARELLTAGAGPRRLRDAPVPVSDMKPDYFERQRSAAVANHRGILAAERLVQCVEATTKKPFAEASSFARAAFEECRLSSSSRALRRLFFAERGSSGQMSMARPVARAAVIGAGTMGAGIAVSLATAGMTVTLIDAKPEALEAGLQRVRTAIDSAVKKGRLNATEAAATIERVSGANRIEDSHDADLIIEAVFENLNIKREIFARLSGVCRPGAVLATNTSTLNIDAIAAATARGGDVLGMHFFSPANVMKLVEIVRGRQSSPEAIATALAVTRRMRKIGIVVGNGFGFVGNRMLYGYGRENQLLLLEGASPAQIDAVLKDFGMAMGPNAVGDLAGLDVGYRARRERPDPPADPRYYRVADMLVEAGRLGQKSGKGTYLYEAGSRSPVVDPEVDRLIAAEAARLGVRRRTVSDEEIRERCIFALINEGAQILQEGIAAAASDIDAIWCNGYGFPRFRGGPMFYADTLGLPAVLAAIERLAADHGQQYWTAAPLLRRLVVEGRTFDNLRPAPAATAARRLASGEQ